MGNDLTITKDEKYNALVDEIKSAITEYVHLSRWYLIEGYWTIGKLIRTEQNSQEGKSTTQLLTALSVDIGTSKRTLWRALACYDKYPDINTIPEGKNISWNKLLNKYLLTPKEQEDQEECVHKRLKCLRCKKEFSLEELKK